MGINRREFLKITAGSGFFLTSRVQSVFAAQTRRLPPEAVGILYDATLCIGCKSCMVNCKKYNSTADGALANEDGAIPYEFDGHGRIWDAPRDLSAKTLSIIKVYKNGSGLNKDEAVNGYSFIKQHCLHCLDPACVSVCPVAALQKNPVTGVVYYDKDRCIGCRYCQIACPFQIPRFEWENAAPQIRKCQLCQHRYAEGKYAACCEFCPTGASIFGKVTDLRREARQRLNLAAGSEYAFPVQTVNSSRKLVRPVSRYMKQIYGMHEAGGTQYMLMAGVPFDMLGFNPEITDEVYADLTWNYITHIPPLIAALLLAGTASYYLTRRKDDAGGTDKEAK